MKRVISRLIFLLILATGACALPPLVQPNPAVTSETATPETAISENAELPAVATNPPDATSTALEPQPTAAAPEATLESAVTQQRILIPTDTPAVAQAAIPRILVADTPLAGTGPVLPPADEVSARLQVPTGFAVRGFAAGMDKPRLMAFGPDNVLYVADQNSGEVLRLPDANKDGLADTVQVIAAGLDGAHSVEWFEGWLYVASFGAVNRFQDQDGDGTFETKELVTDNIPGRGGHSTRTLHFGPDGKLYVVAGSSSNNAPESDPRRAALLRFNPDGTIPADNPFAANPLADNADERRQAVWAEGLRNSVDFLFLPDGRLWANHNGSDLLGDNLPPEEIVIEIEKGGHYGWPYCYTPTVGGIAVGVIAADVHEVRDERVALDPDVLASCNDAIPARFTDLAHYAPLGMIQYNAPAAVAAFPAAYQGNLFVAYHGSWNSSDQRDCRVQMIVVQDGQPVDSQPFLTGFRDNEEQQCNSAWGRPAGVAVGPDGALYVSDDQNGQIYRVVYTGE